VAADYQPTTVFRLIALGDALGFGATIDKELARFAIAANRADPQLAGKLSAADPALVNFLGDQLVRAIYNAP